MALVTNSVLTGLKIRFDMFIGFSFGVMVDYLGGPRRKGDRLPFFWAKVPE
jgi:hypothetical protein